MKKTISSKILLIINKFVSIIPQIIIVSIVLLFCFGYVLANNVSHYISSAKALTSLGDIIMIELAMTKMLSDAQLDTADAFFDPDKVADFLADGIIQGGTNPVRITGVLTTHQFQRAQDMYTHTFISLLKHGRTALQEKEKAMDISFSAVLRKDRVNRLGTCYLGDSGTDDSWGNSFQIFPGPWPNNTDPSAKGKEPNGNLIVFRINMPQNNFQLSDPRHYSGQPDALSINFEPATPPERVAEVQDPDTRKYEVYGYPAPLDKKIFIYSLGKNMLSGQAIYSNSGYSWKSYEGEDSLSWGGGDDVNNWDNDQSWMRFYN